MAKAPLGVTVADTPGSKGKPLGIWPLEFTQRYSMQDSFIARVGGIRKTALRHLQHYDSQNTELQAAKVAGRPANVPDVHARGRRLQEVKRVRDTAYAQRNVISEQVASQTMALKPFAAPKTAHEIAMQAEYRSVLRSAPDDKARAQLLRSFEYRQAALADGAHASLSGISPSAFDRLRHQELLRVHPEAMQVAADFEIADDILGNHLAALDAMIETESRALGAPLVEPKPKPPAAEWE
jgi:hypothetical protein